MIWPSPSTRSRGTWRQAASGFFRRAPRLTPGTGKSCGITPVSWVIPERKTPVSWVIPERKAPVSWVMPECKTPVSGVDPCRDDGAGFDSGVFRVGISPVSRGICSGKTPVSWVIPECASYDPGCPSISAGASAGGDVLTGGSRRKEDGAPSAMKLPLPWPILLSLGINRGGGLYLARPPSNNSNISRTRRRATDRCNDWVPRDGVYLPGVGFGSTWCVFRIYLVCIPPPSPASRGGRVMATTSVPPERVTRHPGRAAIRARTARSRDRRSRRAAGVGAGSGHA